MAGQLKEVRNRIKSVQNMQQITKAMKMVSAAKLRKAQDSIIQMRPYAKKLQEVLGNIVSSLEGEVGMELAETRPVEKVLLIVITSDRGLCGAYNSNLIKLAKQTIETTYAEQFKNKNVEIWAVGKKGYEHFEKRGYRISAEFRDLLLNVSFESAQAMAQAAVKAFKEKKFDVVEIVYSEFKNAASQKFKLERFLPIPTISDNANSGKKTDFIFEPEKEVLIAELMPKILNTQLYKAILDANASEHGARMTAMDKASENADEM